MGDGWMGLVVGESVRLCVNLCPLWYNNLCPLWYNNLCPLLDNNLYLLLDNKLCLLWDNVLCGTIPSVDTFYLIWDIG
jgi:hypothetical protein